MESLIITGTAILVALAILVSYIVRFARRDRADRARRDEAVALGVERPAVQHPIIDEIRCIGCGSCVAACPEGDVLGVVAGRAVIVNGLRCVGHGRCEEVCPVGAIRIGLGEVAGRDDIPLLSPARETSVPGLYVAGELGGFSLIRNAVHDGRAIIEHMISAPGAGSPDLDLLIVGGGPAGLTAALAARQHGLRCTVIDQQGPGGTILQYPRKKLVLTQPVEIPLYGTLALNEYTKEAMLEIWLSLLRQFEIELRHPERVTAVRRMNGHFEVRSTRASYRARHVILAMGRRGTPRRLGVSGEDRPKVAYQLKDAGAYHDHDILVVGGGDSAVEAAMALARQPGNRVTLSYRRPKLVRVRRRNEERITPLLESGAIRGCFGSEVRAIGARSVRLASGPGEFDIANDFVFILAGGEPPFALLREAGVAFASSPPPAGTV